MIPPIEELIELMKVRSPEFEAWAHNLPAQHWAKQDISAARIGWEAAKALYDQPTAALSPAQLDAANVGLACESVRLQEALAFYAERRHIVFTDDAEERNWETGSDPEAPNWMDREGIAVMIEDGGIAREALKPFEVTPDPTADVP